MEGNFQQTSFIPKKVTVDSFQKPVRHGSFFSLVTIVIFLTIVALAAAVFGYKVYLQKSINDTKDKIDVAAQAIDMTKIGELARLNSRIDVSKQLLDQHLSLSTFMVFLGQSTLKSIRFSNFGYVIGSAGPAVVMSGEAQNFDSVALQADEFSKPDNQRYIQNPTLSDLNLDKSGNVTFNFRADIRPSSFIYRGTLNPADKITSVSGTTTASTTASTTKR